MIVSMVWLTLASSDWLLGPRDLIQTPTKTSLGTETRKAIEDPYYATPFYERDALATREREPSTGFDRIVWLSLHPRVGRFRRLAPQGTARRATTRQRRPRDAARAAPRGLPAPLPVGVPTSAPQARR